MTEAEAIEMVRRHRWKTILSPIPIGNAGARYMK